MSNQRLRARIRPAGLRALVILALLVAGLGLAAGNASAAVYTVTNLNDSGAGSLRAALANAVGAAGADVVVFAPALSGTITLSTPLPALNGANASGTEIRGETALDAVMGPDITLDGSGLGFDGIVISGDADTCRVRGLKIRGCRNGIVIVGAPDEVDRPDSTTIGGPAGRQRNVLASNGNGMYLTGYQPGTLVVNSQLVDNGQNGILITVESPDLGGAITIGGPGTLESNLISGNGLHGVFVRNTGSGKLTDIRIAYNWIGLDPTGLAAQPNAEDGVKIYSDPSGTGSVDLIHILGNRISGNGMSGVHLQEYNVTQVTLEDNWIGVDTTGTAAVPNGAHGVLIQRSSNNALNDDEGSNVISGNLLNGIRIESGSSNAFHTCLVGVDASGTAAVGNQRNGIAVVDSSETNQFTNCVVSGNAMNGIVLDGTAGSVQATQFTTCTVGMDSAGSDSLPNHLDGVLVQNDVYNSTFTSCLVSGNRGSGFRLSEGSRLSNILSCAIGTDLGGFTAMPNGSAAGTGGVRIEALSHHNYLASNTISAHGADGQFGVGILDGADDNTVIGNTIGSYLPGLGNDLGVIVTGASARDTVENNVIISNLDHGIWLGGTGNVIIGNRDVANAGSGVYVSGDGNRVGGLRSAGEGNVIGANLGWGIEAHDDTGGAAMSLTVEGNWVGVDTTGSPMGNAEGGVWLGENYRDCTVGAAVADGSTDGGNTITANGGGGSTPAGVRVGETGAGAFAPYGNRILCNSIYANVGGGIELDDLAPDYGNLDVAAPSVTSATESAIAGVTNLPASPVPVVQVFLDGGDEGGVFLGEATVSDTTWSFVPPGGIDLGMLVTATNTVDSLGTENTSEFSEPFAFEPASEPVFSAVSLPSLGGMGRAFAVLPGSSPLATTQTLIGGEIRAAGDTTARAAVWEGTSGSYTATVLPWTPGGTGRVNSLIPGDGISLNIAGGRSGAEPGGSLPAVWKQDSGGTWMPETLPGLDTDPRGEVNGLVQGTLDGLLRAAGWANVAGVPTAALWAWSQEGGWAGASLHFDIGLGSPSAATALAEEALSHALLAVGYATDAYGKLCGYLFVDTVAVAVPTPPTLVEARVNGLSPSLSEDELYMAGEGLNAAGDMRGAVWETPDLGMTWPTARELAPLPGYRHCRATSIGLQDNLHAIVGSSFDDLGNSEATIWLGTTSGLDTPGESWMPRPLIAHPPIAGVALVPTNLSVSGGMLAIAGWGSAPTVSASADTIPFLLTMVSSTEVPGVVSVLPAARLSLAVSPNPASNGAGMIFAARIPATARASLVVYDVGGRRVRQVTDGVFTAGVHQLAWDGRDERGGPAAPGIYFAVLRSGKERDVAKLAVVR
jgi:parallel beta-helix repeat protein